MVIATLIFCSIYYLYSGYYRESKNERLIMVGLAFTFFGLAIARICVYFSVFFIKGNYSGHSYYGSFTSKTSTYEILIFSGYISVFLGFILFFFTFEKATRRKKYIMTLISIIFLGIIIIEKNFFWIATGIAILVIFSFFVLYSKRSKKDFQTISAHALIGTILIWLGYFLDAVMVKELRIISPTFPALFFILGTLISLSKGIVEQALNAFSSLVIVALLYIVFTYQIPLFILIYILIGISLYCFMLIFAISREIYLLQSQKIEILGETDKNLHKLQDFMKHITQIKPKKLTEEEITFYKEQKICIVCKGKTSRLTYICPVCEALYCVNCSTALSNLENACWVCETAFDESKPVKIEKKAEEEKIIIKAKTPKEDLQNNE
jgi:hypothetical protein